MKSAGSPCVFLSESDPCCLARVVRHNQLYYSGSPSALLFQ